MTFCEKMIGGLTSSRNWTVYCGQWGHRECANLRAHALRLYQQKGRNLENSRYQVLKRDNNWCQDAPKMNLKLSLHARMTRKYWQNVENCCWFKIIENDAHCFENIPSFLPEVLPSTGLNSVELRFEFKLLAIGFLSRKLSISLIWTKKRVFLILWKQLVKEYW